MYEFDAATSLKFRKCCDAYNLEVDRYKRLGKGRNVDDFVDYRKVKWSSTLKGHLSRSVYAEFDARRLDLHCTGHTTNDTSSMTTCWLTAPACSVVFCLPWAKRRKIA